MEISVICLHIRINKLISPIQITNMKNKTFHMIDLITLQKALNVMLSLDTNVANP